VLLLFWLLFIRRLVPASEDSASLDFRINQGSLFYGLMDSLGTSRGACPDVLIRLSVLDLLLVFPGILHELWVTSRVLFGLRDGPSVTRCNTLLPIIYVLVVSEVSSHLVLPPILGRPLVL
jgi:hypothetical protein